MKTTHLLTLGVIGFTALLMGSQAVATYDSVPEIPIYTLQGPAHRSAYVHKGPVKTQGIVTAVTAQGFFLQDPTGDQDPKTSDAIFVTYRPPYATPQTGMLLQAQGTINEVAPSDPSIGLTRTTLEASQLSVLKQQMPLPEPVILGSPIGRALPKQVVSSYQGDVNEKSSLNLSEGLDFYESLESMRVRIPKPRLIAPGSAYGELYLIADQGQEATPGLNARHSLLLDLENQDFQPEILVLKNPAHADVALEASTGFDARAYRKGDLFQEDIEGILDFNLSARPGFFVGGYFIYPTYPLPDIIPAELQAQQTQLVSGPRQLTVANYNVENLSPADPAKLMRLGQHIAKALKAPDILMLQEIADNDGAKHSEVVDAQQTLKALTEAIERAGGPHYDFIEIPPLPNQDGGLPGANIRVAYLYQPERVGLKAGQPGQSDASVTVTDEGYLSTNPGRLAVNHPAFVQTRKSLAVEFLFQEESVICINIHLSSKRGDGPIWSAYQPPVLKTMPQRLRQTQVLQAFTEEILQKRPHAKLILAGDFNEFYAAEPLQVLKAGGLYNLIETLPFAERYTYLFKGVSQTLDHLFVSDAIYQNWQPEVEIVHLNAEFGPAEGAASDHDPVVARFTLPDQNGH